MNTYERIAQLIYEGRIARLAKAIRKAEAKGNTEKVRKLFDPAMVAIKKRQRSEDKRAKDLYITTSFEKGVNARMARRKKKEQKEKEQNESFSIDEGIQRFKRLYQAGKKKPNNPEIAAAKTRAGNKFIRSLDKRVKERGQTPEGFAKVSMKKEIAAQDKRGQKGK
jgi:hypothetical protein